MKPRALCACHPVTDISSRGVRLQQLARERRDRIAGTLRHKYSSKLAALENRRKRAEWAEQRQESERNQAVAQSALSVGADLLGAFLGGRPAQLPHWHRASSLVGKAGRVWKEGQDVDQAAALTRLLAQQAAELEAQFQAELAAQQAGIDPAGEALKTVSVRVKKANLVVQTVALCWLDNSLIESAAP